MYGDSSEHDVESGVHPEELEVECTLLERILNSHKNQVEDSAKQRRIARFLRGEAAEDDDHEDGEDGLTKEEDVCDAEDLDDQPKLHRSEIRDCRLDGILQRTSKA